MYHVFLVGGGLSLSSMSCIQNANSGRVFIGVGWSLCRYTLEPPVDLCNMWTVCTGSPLCEVCVLTSSVSLPGQLSLLDELS